MTKTAISIGKYRALQRASTSTGLFNVLAIDHQDALRRALNPDDPFSIDDATMSQFKLDVVGALIDDVSGVLLDPLYGAFQAISQNTLKNKGLLVELEKADYQLEPMPLDVEIDDAWSVHKIKGMHADGVKLFFYYNPDNEAHCARQEKIIRQIGLDCIRYDIPFYAEPIVYQDKDKSPQTQTYLVTESARRIAPLNVDVLKLEFPFDVKTDSDEASWLKSCQTVTEAINVPWVLLSAGVSFEMFTRQLEVACRAGASGFIVGRALWGEVAEMTDRAEQLAWLNDIGRQRLASLNTIVESYGASWHDIYSTHPASITPNTFRQYQAKETVTND